MRQATTTRWPRPGHGAHVQEVETAMPRRAGEGTTKKSRDEKTQGFISEFSNGVFAFAITLLVLEIRLPTDVSKSTLGPALLSIWPNYLGFLLSFLVIGLMWSSYIRLLRDIVRTDHLLIMLNLLYLLFIVVVPFSTSLISLYRGTLVVVIYASLMACAGYMYVLLRIYAGRNHRLVSKRHSTIAIRRGILLNLIMPVWFTLSIGIALFNILASQLSSAAAVFGYTFLWHRLRDRVVA
jgi:uncharacterized membrane protein